MHRLALTAIIVSLAASHAADAQDPQTVWEQVLQAKGGRERLHNVRSLAIYMKPAQDPLAGPLATWLCVFPDRYFQFTGRSRGSIERAIIVDAKANRMAMDGTGMTRKEFRMGPEQQEQLTLNQLLYLLDTAWVQPKPVGVKGKVLTIEAGGRTFHLGLNSAHLPEKISSPPVPGQKPKIKYDYHMQNYREFAGIMLPARVSETNGAWGAVWDVDYEVDAKYNPALFQRIPDLAAGPEPWRQR